MLYQSLVQAVDVYCYCSQMAQPGAGDQGPGYMLAWSTEPNSAQLY